MIQKLEKSKTKKKDKVKQDGDDDDKDKKKDKDSDEEEYVTVLKPNYLSLDYSSVVNVKDRLEVLKQERRKGKYEQKIHL